MNQEAIKPILRIAEAKDFSEEVVADLSNWFDVEIAPCAQEHLKDTFEQCDIFWFRLGFRISADLFSEKTRCKVLATPVTGIDHIDENACKQRGIQVICLRGETSFLREVRATAELTIALTLALLRQLVPAAQDVVKGNWNRDGFRGREIYKKTVGIVGMGRLGNITAGYFKAMGAKVIGFDIRDDFPEGIEQMPSLEHLVEASDIVSLHVSYNASTHHLFGESVFNCFDKNKVLINTSRGGIIHEESLLKALKDGNLGGAALDVLQGEDKISAYHPLLAYARQHNNLLIVPHIGGNTYESFEKTEWFIAGKIKEAFFVESQI